MLRRKLVLQDTIALLLLLFVTVSTAVLTYFLFGSFSAHRKVLQQRWFERGKQAMAVGRPAEAVVAFRSALTLAPTDQDYELNLAQALAAAGQTDEAYTYFTSLLDAQPGDGFLNLELARLQVKKNQPASAIASYDAALNGAWHGKGADRRREIRFELIRYLLSVGQKTEAQGELLTAEGNSLDEPAALFEIASLLREADDPFDAFAAYRRVEQHPRSTHTQVVQSLLAEAQISVNAGQYKRAAEALDRYRAYVHRHPTAATPAEREAAQQQMIPLQRILELIPSSGLPPKQRAERIAIQRDIAGKRYQSCLAQLTLAADTDSDKIAPLTALQGQWKQMMQLRVRDLTNDPATEQALTSLINQTEIETAKLCGQPLGDDALLFQLAKVPDRTE